MRTVKGFDKAKKLLDRSINLDDSVASAVALKPGEVSTEEKVKSIIDNIRKRGDKALLDYTKQFDGVKLEKLEVTPKEIAKAYKVVDKKLVSNLKSAARRVAKFHSLCMKKTSTSFESDGVGRRVRPLNRVGIYVPGGTAAYPSTVLMTAVPAKIAGVNEMIMVSPPQKDGSIPAPTLVAADIAKVNRIFKIGGAQAIAALAFGTETIPKVDKICGPGNIFVAVAKKLVYGAVDIDGIQGPSEIIVVADDYAKPSYCAADLIAQAEHDAMASAILITDSLKIASEVGKELEKQLAASKRKAIVKTAIDSRGMIVIVDNLDEAIELVNLFAPEHLLLMIRNAKDYLKNIQNAGCVFLSETSPVVIGDYIAGPSHVLPTGGTARFSSPLSIESFLKAINYVSLSKEQQDTLGKITINLAEAEGLPGHAAAVKIRLKDKKLIK